MAGLPERVQIGAVSYAIVRDGDALMRYEHTQKAGVYGVIRYAAQDILVDPMCGEDKAKAILLHEVLHGCNHAAGFAGVKNEERIVTALAYSLLDTLQRNPALVAYLVGE